jgi:poly(A) polymerase
MDASGLAIPHESEREIGYTISDVPVSMDALPGVPMGALPAVPMGALPPNPPGMAGRGEAQGSGPRLHVSHGPDHEGPPRLLAQPGRHEVVFDEARIDPDVQKVLRRLVRMGHEAYLVGGGVRDLLLDRRPKDFDVATSARPEEVRELFRNSRIIGRRFRLVHVLFQGGKVIEVATFRKSPKEETDEPSLNGNVELLIRSDNVFGVASEDALRRDFTINALFYDLEKRQILDWVGGMDDVRRRVVHTIGDPETRFREDPVRILRALKFAGRLDLGITPDVYDAIVFCREALALAARPRLSEEILRLLRGGQARRTIYLAWETGVLEVLLPELAALLYDDGEEEGPGHRVWRLLDHIDRRTAAEGPLDDTVLWTLLLLEPMKEACEGAKDRAAAVADFLEPLIERIAISRRYADGMRRIVSVLPRLVSGKAGRFARTEMFQLAVEVAAAELYSRGEPTFAVDQLRASSVPRPGREGRDAPPPRARRDRQHGGREGGPRPDGSRGRR